MPPTVMPSIGQVRIDFSALDALPDKGQKGNKIIWTPELDSALMTYWPTKRHDQVAKILGLSQTSCIIRFRELTE